MRLENQAIPKNNLSSLRRHILEWWTTVGGLSELGQGQAVLQDPWQPWGKVRLGEVGLEADEEGGCLSNPSGRLETMSQK